MYTVVRFTSGSLPHGALERLGEALNKVVPGAFTRLRHAGDGFACEITDSDQWAKHHAAILSFVHRSTSVIGEAMEAGVDVCVDVAIEPEDMREAAVLSVLVDPILSGRLAEAGVTLMLSIFGHREQAEP
jgi:hypothetical protein